MKTPLIRVLLIEDKTADADLIQEGLKGQSAQFYEVATVADLTTAIEHLKTSLPDIILTNLNLPDSTGIATVLALRTAAPHLPIVVMAGEDHVEGVGLEVIRAGAQDYFLKNQQDSGYLSRTLRYALERQKIAHQQLESINHYQLVSEVASDYRFSAKVDESGKVTQNLPTGAIEKITGYSAEEFLKTGGWRAHLHPDDLWINDRNQEQLYQDHSIDSEIRMLRKDGSVAWVQVFVVPIWSKEPNRLTGFYGSVRDITKRKHAEKSLQESQERFKLLFDQAPLGMALTDSITGQYDIINQRFAEIAGRSVEELASTEWMQLTHPDDLQSDLAQMKQLNAGKIDQYQMEKRFIQPDGTIVWTNMIIARVAVEQGNHPHHLCMLEDITERRQTERALRDSESSLLALIDAVDHSLFLMELDGTVVAINETTAKRVHSSPSELVGKDIYTYVDSDVAELRRDYAEKAIETKQPVRFTDQRFGRWIDNSIYPVLDETGEVYRLAIYGRDITEHKQLESALESRIVALTRPMDETGDIDFKDLFDMEAIQRLQDEFSIATGVASLITTPDGTPITTPSNYTHLCNDIIQGTEQGRLNCYQSDTILGQINNDSPTIQPCLSCGLWDAGTSITVGGRHIANWLVGQVRDETQTEEKMRAYAREIKADEDAFIDAFHEVPLMSQEQFKQVAQTVFTLANQLSNIAYQNVQQARFITEVKQAEKKLRDSEALLNKIFDVLPIGIWFADKNGTLQRGNPAGTAIWGAEPHVSLAEYGIFKARRLPSGEEIAAEDWALAHTIAEGVTILDELLEIDAFDGEKRVVLNSTVPILNDAGKIQGAIILNQDVTEREKVINRLRQSEERYRMVVSSATEGIILQQKSGEILTWNSSAEHIFGVTKSEAVGQTSISRHWDIYNEDGSYLPGEEHPSMRTFATGQACHDVIVKVVRDDDSFSWVSIDTNPVFLNGQSKHPDAVVITVQDITKRHQAEENLKERERELSAMMDNLPGMAYRCKNDQDWTMLFVSQGVFELTGFQPEDLINNQIITYQDLVHPADREMVRQEIQTAVAESRSFVIEYRIINAAGIERWVWERGYSVAGEKGEVEILEGFVTDITERRKANEILEESENRFRTLYEQSPGPHQSLVEQGMLLQVNRAWLNELNYSTDEVIGHWFGDFLTEEDCEQFPQRFEQFKQLGEIHGSEFEMLRKNGSSIQVSFEGRIVRDSQGNFVQTHCVFTNISERKKIEAKLLQSAEDLIRAQSIAHVGSWKWTILTNQLEWSDEMYIIFGIDKATFTGDLGDVITQAVHPDDREALEESNRSVLMEGKPIPLEYRVVHSDGEIRTVWAEAGELSVDDQGNPKVLTGIVQDITDRKKTEVQLLLQDNALRAAANGIVITNLAGTIEWANPAFCEMTGYPIVDVIGKNPRDLVKSGKHGPEFYTEMWETILSGDVWQGEFINRRKDGSFYHEHTIITPILDSKQKITNFIAIKEDVSQRKAQEQSLLRQTYVQEKIVAMGRALGATIDINIICRTTYRYVHEIMDVSNMGITLFDRDDQQLNTVFSVGNRDIIDIGPLLALASKSDDNSDYSEAIANHRPIILTDLMRTTVESDVKTEGESNVFLKSAIYVPMVAEGESIGVIDLQSYQKDMFTTETAEWLSMIANQTALAIQNSRLYEQIRKRVAQLSGLREIDMAINAHQPMETIYQLILNQVRYQLGIDAADILTLNADEKGLTFQAGYGFDINNGDRTAINDKWGLAEAVAEGGRTIQYSQSDQSGAGLENSQGWSLGNFEAYIGLPLWINKKVVGVLEVFQGSLLSSRPEWLQYLETLAGQTAIAIENNSLITDLQKTAANLLQAYDATIAGWSQAMDLRDHETEGHTQRVSELAIKMARAMGFPEDKLLHVRRGALLHDIGKLGVPDQILLKPGALTPEEWVIMKQHPEYAFGMLSKIEYLRPAIEIPYYHHERWDGSGYPIGLAGEKIPLSARIFAVVDVWDAVTNDRIYRDAWSVEKALEHIRAERGKHFDPKVVDIFFKVVQPQDRQK